MDRENVHGSARGARPGHAARRRRRQRRIAARPGLEGLEPRRLLTRAYPFPTVPPNVRNVLFEGAVYTVRVDGPGAVRLRPDGAGAVGLDLFGTTSQSVVTIARGRAGLHAPASTLPIGSVEVRTGQLGAIVGGSAADLVGPMTPLAGGVGAIQFHAFGPRARVEVRGGLGLLAADAVTLGPSGRIQVGSLGGLQVGGMRLDGGQVLVDQGIGGEVTIGDLVAINGGRLAAGGNVAGLHIVNDVALAAGGTLTVGADLGGMLVGDDLGIGPGGRFDVGRTVVGGLGVAGSLGIVGGQVTIGTDLAGLTVGRGATVAGGGLTVGRDVTGPVAVGGDLALDAGLVLVGRDLAAPLAVGNDLLLSNGATLAVIRDARAPIDVGGNVVVADAAHLLVGRDLAGLRVAGNLDTSGGGAVLVGGNLLGLDVTGALIGKGVVGNPDLVVGLNLANLAVRGFVPGRGGIVGADIAVGKSLVGLDVAHGIFDSFLTAGVLIDGGPPLPGGNIGPDGPVAVFDSEIRAGVQIRNLTINGDVVSDRVTNPAGRPTRIVAGQDRAGTFSPGGSIDNFQITGALIDAVLAASVAPEGGDGTLTDRCLPIPGDGTYDAPAGVLPAGTFGDPVFVPHASPASYDPSGRLTGYDYDTSQDPTIDDCILPGAINRSFAPPAPTDTDPAAPIPLPTKSTVLGGVIQTRPHGDEVDYPGLFAADTRGVWIGRLPGA